ncbi:hypothetical protein C6499_22530 [Candidatus Poribacteria bacterium]|nr:MAG: hypothetical protein C6499_22530 [Candidatus Poribacteria bacterium]
MLHGKMAIRGTPNTQSLTMVSGNQPPVTATLSLSVVIRPPMASRYTGRVATIVFDFENNNGQPAPVSGFGIGSLIGDPGGEIFRFTKVSNSRYTCDVRFIKRTGNWTITVLANAATLIADPNVTGPSEDTSATIELGIVAPIVKIGVPTQRPITQRPIPLTFDWTYTDDTPVPMENFVQADAQTDVGTIGNFQQVSGDASKYTAELTIPPSNTSTKVTITVSAESAQVANSNPAVLGPLEDTSKTFEIAAPTAVAQVTGADEVCVLEKDIIANDVLNDVIPHLGDNAGGAFTCVLESIAISDYVYLVVQVRKFTQTVNDDGELVTPTNPENFLSNGQAGAVLVRVNTANCQFEVLKAYSDMTLAARSLTVNGNMLYFMEGSHYVYEDETEFSDPDYREKIGHLYKIEHPASTIQTVGRNWRSASTDDNPDTEETDYFYGIHGGTASPIIIADEVLHLITGFGNFDDIGQPRGEFPVNRIGNWNWIQHHNQINQRLSEVLTNGRTGFDVLKDIAILTNAIIGFKNDTFFMRPREPQKALNGGGSGISATQRSVTAAKLNWGEFPNEGWLFIDGELIKHTGADENGQFANLVRGAEDTTAAAHTGNFDITFVDHILALNADVLEMPIKSIVATNDLRQFYNRVRLRYGDGEAVLVEDATSITENGARLLEVDIPLDAHQRVWAEWLANAYLARFKEIKQILNLTLKPTFYMNVGDVVYLKIQERLHLNGNLCQVLEIRHAFRQPPTTSVKLVTL